MFGQGSGGDFPIKMHVAANGEADVTQKAAYVFKQWGKYVLIFFGNEQLRRLHAGEVVKGGVKPFVPAVCLVDQKVAGGYIEKGKADNGLFFIVFVNTEGRDKGVAFFIKDLFVGGDARGDDPHHLTAHDSFCLLWVFHLLTDGNPVPGLDHFAEVSGNGVKRHSAHGNFIGRILGRAGGKRYAEHPGGGDGIVEEHLVKIAHAVKEDGVLVLFLDLHVLAEHGRHLQWFAHGASFSSRRRRKSGASSSNVCWICCGIVRMSAQIVMKLWSSCQRGTI